MTVKVLIVDPDISFTVPIKRALEISGDYKVNVFASGSAALELLQRDSHDVAILDLNIDDIELPALIEAMRRIQPWLFVLVSPHNQEQTDQVSKLDIQGSIPKPYVARQLGPVIREAAAARARYSKKPGGRIEELSRLPDLKEEHVAEPQVQPDDTFRRAVDMVKDGDTSKMRPVEPESAAIDEPPVPENSTVRELVSGQTAPSTATAPVSSPSSAAAPPSLPEPPTPDLAGVAEVALEIADDDTVPLDELSQTLAERVETLPPEYRPADLPNWAPGDSPDQPTLIEPAFTPDDTRQSSPEKKSDKPLPPMLDEPAFVAEIFEEMAPETPEPPPESAPKLDLETVFAAGLQADQGAVLEQETQEAADEDSGEALDKEMAMSFAPLLTADDSPPEEPPSGQDESSSVHTALAILGVESVDELEKTPEEAPARAARRVDPVAAMALQLTQLTVESSAQVSVLSRGATLVAMAGLLPDRDVEALLQEIGRAWQSRDLGQNAAIFRYIQLPGGSDFLMYSTPTVDNMILTTLFPGDIPLKQIRRQSKQLREALEKVPEPAEPPASITQLSRPTDLRPPQGLRNTVAEPAPDVVPSAEPPAEASAAPEAARPEAPYASYAFVWLPSQEPLAPELAEMALDWLHSIAREHFWKIEGAEIQPTYVMVQIGIPPSETPSATVELLKHETAVRAGQETLWADAYYVITPGRAVTQQEIANFIAYQRGVA